jgi:DNA-binding NtrC family response regulator
MSDRRILLIEDEPQLLLLLEKHLKRMGFIVDACATGSAALNSINQQTVYDLVVADMGLPDMNGEALLAKIFELRPALPVLICSGTEFFISGLPKNLQHQVRFLQKPFLPRELAQKIEEALGPARS